MANHIKPTLQDEFLIRADRWRRGYYDGFRGFFRYGWDYARGRMVAMASCFAGGAGIFAVVIVATPRGGCG